MIKTFKVTGDEPISTKSETTMPTITFPFKNGEDRGVLAISGVKGIPKIKEINIEFEDEE